MKLLALFSPVDRPDLPQLMREHGPDELRALWELYEQGFVREMYQRRGPGAVLIVEADDENQARARLEDLPLARAGAIALELIELLPFAAYGNLFADA